MGAWQKATRKTEGRGVLLSIAEEERQKKKKKTKNQKTKKSKNQKKKKSPERVLAEKDKILGE